MKIQATFEKGVKKQFKEKCIKKLSKFVEDIKKEQQNWREGDNSLKKYLDYDDEAHDRRNIRQSYVDKGSPRIIQARVFFQQQYEKQSQKQSRGQPSKLAKQNRQNNDSLKNSSRDMDKQNAKGLSLEQMRGSVDRIMEKLQENARKQSLDHKELRQKLVETNEKVDKILFHFENIVESEVKITSFQTEEQLLATTHSHHSPNFEDKFLALINRYNYIRDGSRRHHKEDLGGGKSPFQFDSTGDSLTFRHF